MKPHLAGHDVEIVVGMDDDGPRLLRDRLTLGYPAPICLTFRSSTSFERIVTGLPGLHGRLTEDELSAVRLDGLHFDLDRS